MLAVVKKLRSAEADILEAAEWYDDQKLGLGEDFIRAVNSVIESLATDALLHRIRFVDVRRAGVKRFLAAWRVLFCPPERGGGLLRVSRITASKVVVGRKAGDRSVSAFTNRTDWHRWEGGSLPGNQREWARIKRGEGVFVHRFHRFPQMGNGCPQESQSSGNRCFAQNNLCESVLSVDNPSVFPAFA